jgi:acetaldehyde dehydrogenase (acetylating)
VKGFDPDLRALQDVRDQVARAKKAQKIATSWSQETVDRVCRAMADAGARAAYDLARLAVQETGIGRVHYKVLKNLLGSEGVWASIKDEKTVGIVARHEDRGVYEVATPSGVVAGIVPTTNPTSTAMFKAMISVKGRNACVISPHPRAARCIGETVEVLRRAIEREGGPPDLVTVLSNPTIESTGALMKHRDIALILSTGGAGLVRAAYSSGKPAYGVGPGNVPAFVDRSADLKQVAHDITISQSFDNGTLCCSEQALVLDEPIADRVLGLLVERGAHLCNAEETRKLEAYANVSGHMNPDIVGLDPYKIAEAAGFRVSRNTTILLAPQNGVGPEHKLSIEILCPLLSVHRVDGWEAGCDTSMQLLHQGGLGHTMSVHAGDEHVLEQFFLQKPASRIVANGPSSQGAVGFSTNLLPSFSLGCGPQAGNITSENISARHLINIKRVAFKRRDWAQIDHTYHQRALALTGDGPPRGSGLRGDPALEAGVPVGQTREPESSFRADVPLERPAGVSLSGSSSAPKSQNVLPAGPVAVAKPAPTFTRSTSSPVSHHKVAVAAPPPVRATNRSVSPQTAAPIPARPAHVASPKAASSNTSRGAGLTSTEIRTILAGAGSGCPMGPCQGCPHQDMVSGACLA